MSTTTADQQLVIPIGTDGAFVPTAFTDFVAGVETRLVLKYASLADRTARHTSPQVGDTTDLLAEGRTDVWNGSAYVSQRVRGLYARRMRTTNAAAINNSTTLVSDAVLTVPFDTTGLYTFRGRIYYDASAVADFKLAFTFPAVAANGAKWGLIGRDTGTSTSLTMPAATASASALAAGGNGVGTTTFVDFDGFLNITATGNLVAQYAQNTLEATNLTVQFGSYLEVAKVS